MIDTDLTNGESNKIIYRLVYATHSFSKFS